MGFLQDNAAALIALAGTLVGAFLGYRQWRKQQNLATYGRFLQERQTAYEALWTKLEAVHLSIRSADFEEAAFRELVRVVNTHLISVGLYLDRGEKQRVSDYLAALGDLGRLLTESAASEARENAKRSMHDTAAIPLNVLDEVKGLKGAYDAVEGHRERLILHFREVLGAHLVL